jgi:lysophospholipase L1-like esterase
MFSAIDPPFAARRAAPILLLLVGLLGGASDAAAPENGPWEKEIRAFEKRDRQQPPPEGAVLFVGSSSIRLWNLSESFPGVATINRGFGGSQLVDSVQFAERIVIPYRPKLIVVYAGDNDIAAGKMPTQVAGDFKQFVGKVRPALPETPIAFLSIKPSIKRWALIDRIRAANRLIEQYTADHDQLLYVDVFAPMLGPDGQPRKELFRDDGLHLNAAGYKLWATALKPVLNTVETESTEK